VNSPGTAVFLGGVSPESPQERELAYRCGKALGRLGYTLFHGGYNGLMEDAARGAFEEGVEVFAITLAGKEEWGEFNPYVTRSLFLSDMGQRLNAFFSSADVVVAMAGGIGTLHEITAAIWYASNVRPIPIILLGERAERLLTKLKEQLWVYESPTRPVDFLCAVRSAEELDTVLNRHQQLAAQPRTQDAVLGQRVLDAAMVNGRYVRADGSKLDSYFDAFRLSADPDLIREVAVAMAAQVNGRLDVVAGIALGGVSLATHLASVLGKPLLIVRPGPKPYGTNAYVEGVVNSGARALLVDDVVRNGTAFLAARRALESVSVVTTKAACVLSYGHSGYDVLRDHGVILHSLVHSSSNNTN
jgi:uncharacterized protein (TIGR00725 family)